MAFQMGTTSTRGSMRQQSVRFSSSDFFVLRTPLLPFDQFLQWSDGLEAPRAHADASSMAKSITADRNRLRARLRLIVKRAEVREALFVASPELIDNLDVWFERPDSRHAL